MTLTLPVAALPPATADAPWPTAVTVSDTGVSPESTDLTTAPDGTTTAVWKIQATDFVVQTSTRPPGGAWSTPVTLSDLGQNADLPQVATGPDGITTAIWIRTDGTGFRVQLRTRPPGETWKPVLTLSATDGSATNPKIAYGPDGIATAVWEKHDGAHFMIQASRRSLEGVWTVPVTLSQDGRENRDVHVAVTPNGTAVVGWRRDDGLGNYRVMTSAHPAGGTWGTPEFISDAMAVDGPELATAADGTTTAVWIRDGGAFEHVRSSTRSMAGTWSTEETLSEDGAAHGPDITSGPGGTTVAWARSDGAYARVQATRRTLGGAWTTPVTLSDPGQDSTEPEVASGADGTALVVWTRYDGAFNRAQVAQHPAAGSWSAAANVSGSTTSVTSARVAVGADGTTAFAWIDTTLGFRLGAVVVDDLLAIKPGPGPVVVPDTGPIKGKKKITKSKATYTFSSPTPGATFECRVDKKFKKYVGVSATKAKKPVPWKACSSPYTVKAKKLRNGKHKVFVRAVLGSQVDPTPSVRKFTVLR